MSIEVLVGGLAAAVSLGAGLARTFMQRKDAQESVPVAADNQGASLLFIRHKIEVSKSSRPDPFYDLQRSRLKRLEHGEKVTIWDEISEKAAAESLQQQRRRFDFLLSLRS
jgi:hypothetical protein